MGSAKERQLGKQQTGPRRSALHVGPRSHPEWLTLLLCASLLLVTLAAYSSVIHNSFVNYDDDRYLVGTPAIRQPIDLKLLRWVFTTFAQANWHPITWLSHAIDYHVFGLNASAIHIENVLIHALSAVLLFLLLQKASGRPWRSVTVAALYALHPINVESVVWAAERKSVLSMLFFMLTLLAYGWYAQRRTIGRYLFVVIAFMLGLMAKPQIVTLPFILLLWDVWPLNRWPVFAESGSLAWRDFSRLVVEKIPLFLLAALSSVLTWRAQSAWGATRSLVDYPFALRLANALVAYALYLWALVWPSRLTVFYPLPQNFPAWQIALAAGVLLAISTLVWAGRSRRYPVVGWLWFLGTLVPMLGIVRVGDAAMADRYAYLPSIGLFLMVTWFAADWAAEHTTYRAISPFAACAALVLLSLVTWHQVGYWRDSKTLWTHALEVTRDNYVAQDNLGAELVNEGREEEALSHFRQAAVLNPKDAISNRYVGISDENQGNPLPARERLNIAVHNTNDPELNEDAFAYLGMAYHDLHDDVRAKENFEAALHINYSNPIALIGMGLVAHSDGRFPEAINWYSRAMMARPNPVACLLLAKAMEKNGQVEESKGVYQEAANLTANLGAAQRLVEKMLVK